MPEFFNVLPPAEALALLLERLPARPAAGVCTVETPDALGRVTAEVGDCSGVAASLPTLHHGRLQPPRR